MNESKDDGVTSKIETRGLCDHLDRRSRSATRTQACPQVGVVNRIVLQQTTMHDVRKGA